MAAKMHYRDAGVLRTLRRLFFRDAGTLRTIRKAFYRDAGVLRMVFALSHTVSAPGIDVSSVSPDDPSGSSTATVSNGIGPFTHSWAWVSGGGGITLSGQTTQTVTASHTGITGVFTGILRDSVTDTGNGGAVATVDISVTLEKTL